MQDGDRGKTCNGHRKATLARLATGTERQPKPNLQQAETNRDTYGWLLPTRDSSLVRADAVEPVADRVHRTVFAWCCGLGGVLGGRCLTDGRRCPPLLAVTFGSGADAETGSGPCALSQAAAQW